MNSIKLKKINELVKPEEVDLFSFKTKDNSYDKSQLIK